MDLYPFARKKLMTPGPVSLPDGVKWVFSHLECHHRTRKFSSVLNRVFRNLRKVFQTKQHCYLLASTGTGALEASLVNCLSSEDRLFFINAGKFGRRWGEIAKAYGMKHKELAVPWGEDIDLEKVAGELKTGSYKACAFQACETSTGALLPVSQIAKICNQYNVLSIVDGITALGAVDLPMDRLGIDVMIGGSQKAFMLPAGLSFISLSEQAEQVKSDKPCYYFDLKEEKKANMNGKTRYSTPTHFVLALDLVLDKIVNDVGLKRHFGEIILRAQVFRDQVKLDLFPKTSSPSLSCLKIPKDLNSDEIKKYVAKRGYVIMGGQDQLSNRVLRVGHMGDMSHTDLIKTACLINHFIS